MKAKKSHVFVCQSKKYNCSEHNIWPEHCLYFIKPWNLKLSSRRYMEVTHHNVPREAGVARKAGIGMVAQAWVWIKCAVRLNLNCALQGKLGVPLLLPAPEQADMQSPVLANWPKTVAQGVWMWVRLTGFSHTKKWNLGPGLGPPNSYCQVGWRAGGTQPRDAT